MTPPPRASDAAPALLNPPPTGGSARWRWWVLATAIVVISICHYLTPPSYVHWHMVYQRLYYLPILFGSFWYGIRGGLAVALLTSAAYLPHIVLHWGHAPLYRADQLMEIVLFLVIGAVAGMLTDRVRREREEHRSTAEELARAYDQLRETFERLRLVDSLSALGALSAGMAHEVKNPLGSIMGAIEILEAQVAKGDERREFVEILRKEIERLSRIVSSHLDLVRPGSPDRGPCDLGRIVRSVIELTEKQAEKPCIRLSTSVAPDLPPVMADEGQVRQAILNLVINAMQAVREDGHVAVAVMHDDRLVRVVVEDDGPGLQSEALRRAFEPFFTTKERGTGLGLSIAFRIADQHGGDLRAENLPRGGARFCLELPVSNAEPEEIPAQAKGATA